MQDETNPQQTNGDPTVSSQPVIQSGGERVIQPTEAIRQEIQTQQTAQPQAPQPVQPQFPTSPPQGLNQSDAIASVKQQRRKNRLIAGFSVLAGIGVLVIIFVVLTASSVLPLGKFKTVTYDNKVGNTFKLTFYKNYTVKASPYNQNPNNETARNYRGLGSNISRDSKLPIWFGLGGSPGSFSSASQEEKDQADKLLNCVGTLEQNVQKAFTVHIKSIDKDVNVCNARLTPEADPVVYVLHFVYHDRFYQGSFETNVDFSNKDPAYQREIMHKTKFAVYEQDMKEIVSSIQIIK